MKYLWLVLACFVCAASDACTIFVVARRGEVFAAGNEDDDNTEKLSKHYLKFVPANKEKQQLGYVAFGYANSPFSDESAMNEAGLFYDYAVVPKLDRPRDGRPKGKFNAVTEMLSKCRTVAEATHYLEAFDLPNLSGAQILVGDATGASAIIERQSITPRVAGIDFQVATNFRTSTTASADITCQRFGLCTAKLGARTRVSEKLISEILNGAKAAPPSESMTWYSVICDLKRRNVSLYRKGEFSKPVRFSLSAELKKGSRKFDMDEFMGQSK